MIRSRRFRRLGTAVLVASFALATCHVTWRAAQARAHVTVRFAHWQLEGGIREAFDAIARDYEALHPGLRVEQMLIPQRIYASWGTTQVIGGAAPDLVELGQGMGGPEVYSYFRPLTEEIDQPNPYNAGTALAQVPWRNTYADGMEKSYLPETFECYGASVFASSSRIYYNVDLLRTITGSDATPRSFDELLTLCAQVRAYAERTGRVLAPMAGSRQTGLLFLDDLLRNQTQRLACEVNAGIRFPVDSTALYLAYLNGEWSHRHPALQGGAELMRRVGKEMPPGFMQFGREDAMFQFAQGRALMMLAYSQDATSVLRQVAFPVSVFRNPLPRPAATGFGSNLVGKNSEDALHTYGLFGIPRTSPHPELALDFLRFLTSQATDRKFARLAGSLPVIVGIEPEGLMKQFAPDGTGFPPAPTLLLGGVGQVFIKHLHWLAGPNASSAAYLDALGRDLPAAMRTDLENGRRGQLRSVALNDTTIEATRRLLRQAGDERGPLARKYQGLVETQNEQEANAYFTALRLRQAEQHPR